MTQAEKYLESKRPILLSDGQILISLEHAKIACKITDLETKVESLYKYMETCEIGTYSFNITNTEIKEKESEMETLMKL